MAPKPITRDALKNIGQTLAVSASGTYASLDYSALSSVGALLDYTDDVQAVVVKHAGIDYPLLSLDSADDTADNGKQRAAARKYALGALIRNARMAHKNPKLDLRAFYADVPTADGKSTRRGFVVERVN